MDNDQDPMCPCDICGTPTPFTGTKRCDRCWELERRISHDLALARKIMARVLAKAPGLTDRLVLGRLAYNTFAQSMKRMVDDSPYPVDHPPHEEEVAFNDAAEAVARAVLQP